MGCFNFDCKVCGEGVYRDEDGNETGADGRDYFGAPCRILVPTKSGKTIVVEGEYNGYGEVELPDGTMFYPDQFQEYWSFWLDNSDGEMNPFYAGDIYCEDCFDKVEPTSRKEWSNEDCIRVMEMEQTRAQYGSRVYYTLPPIKVAAPTPSAASAAQPEKKDKAAKEPKPKPKPLKKEELQKRVAELEAELEKLRPLESRFTYMETNYKRVMEENASMRKKLDRARDALGYGY